MFSGAETIRSEPLDNDVARTSVKSAVERSDVEIHRILADESIKAKVQEMGFDLHDERFRAEFASRIREEVHNDRMRRAEELGLDLEDKDVKRAIEFFETQRRQRERDGSFIDGIHISGGARWRSYIAPALMVFIFARVAFVVHKLVSTPLLSNDVYDAYD
jgi:magnesium-dependent phosphatase 1